MERTSSLWSSLVALKPCVSAVPKRLGGSQCGLLTASNFSNFLQNAILASKVTSVSTAPGLSATDVVGAAACGVVAVSNDAVVAFGCSGSFGRASCPESGSLWECGLEGASDFDGASGLVGGSGFKGDSDSGATLGSDGSFG